MAYNFSKDFASAGDLAEQKEAQAREYLFARLKDRAARDQAFSKSLARDPEQAVKEASKDLQIPVTDSMLSEAKKEFSRAIPGAPSEDVTALVFSTIEDVRRAFNRTVWLATALFWVGVGLVVAAFVLAALKDQAVETAVFGAGGVASVIASLIMNPMNRVRDAGANLVQIQMAYLAFYKQLDAAEDSEQLSRTATSMISAIQGILAQAPPVHAESPGEPGSAIQRSADAG